jgi:hypothetical protein
MTILSDPTLNKVRSYSRYFALQRRPYHRSDTSGPYFQRIRDVYTLTVLSLAYSPCIPTLYVTMDQSTFKWLHGTHHLLSPWTTYPDVTIEATWDRGYIDNSGDTCRPILFIHLFSVNLLQDMEIVISIIIQKIKQHTVCTYKICEKFVSVCVSNMQ